MSDLELPERAAITAPLPWQCDAWQSLTGLADQGRLPHALLLTGPEGSGRQQFASALSRYLLCQAPVQGVNCGYCKTCLLSQADTHGDWRWLGPVGQGKRIGVEQIREAISFGARTSALGQFKVMLIHPADAMTTAAANAFLKCLEEPAKHTLILLIARAASAVSATIRSRCQQTTLPAPDAQTAQSWLEDLCSDPVLAARALKAANGMPLRAQDLLRREDALARAEKHQVLLEALVTGRAEPGDIDGMLAAMDAEEAVRSLLATLHGYLRTLSSKQLRGPGARALLKLDERLNNLLRALLGGATPQKELLAATLAAQLSEAFGSTAGEC